MKKVFFLFALLFGVAALSGCGAPIVHNTLSPEEVSEGWQLLWNGKDTAGWRGVRSDTFPASGWEIKDGVLSVLERGGGGDIVTVKTYSNFELKADFMLTSGANTGVKYFARATPDSHPGIGLEFQLYDDRRPNARNDGTSSFEMGSLYNLIPASKDKPVLGPFVWRNLRIVVRGEHVEHWLDGLKVVEYSRHSADFRARVAQSKFKDVPLFGEWGAGHILLQDHGNHASFRNIKLREIAPAK